MPLTPEQRHALAARYRMGERNPELHGAGSLHGESVGVIGWFGQSLVFLDTRLARMNSGVWEDGTPRENDPGLNTALAYLERDL